MDTTNCQAIPRIVRNQNRIPGCRLTRGIRAGATTYVISNIGSATIAQIPRILAREY
jgi:hypothetical protein